MAECNVVKMRSKRGGARVGAGRKPGATTKAGGRVVYVIHEDGRPDIMKSIKINQDD